MEMQDKITIVRIYRANLAGSQDAIFQDCDHRGTRSVQPLEAERGGGRAGV